MALAEEETGVEITVYLESTENTELQVCPSCGEFRDLEENSGFCAECTRTLDREQRKKARSKQSTSGKERTEVERPESSSPFERTYLLESTKQIESKEEKWLKRNADILDRLISTGIPTGCAKKIVHHINTVLVCLSCHETFHRGPRGRSLFCKRHSGCKKAARRYRWLKEETNRTHKEAIAYMKLGRK